MSLGALHLLFLAILLAPLLMASWRVSLTGLALQGMVMAAIVVEHAGAGGIGSADAWLSFVDAGCVRGIVVPLLLYRVLRRHAASPRNDVIPPNMIGWTVAGVLVALAFRLAARFAPVGEPRMAIAVATSGVLLGLFILSTQTGPFSQAVGALRIDNAIALFELGAGEEHAPIAIRLGLTLVFLLTAALFSGYVGLLQSPPPAVPPPRSPPL